MILSALAVVLTFGVVIFLHESGHFVLCRYFKVRVERFAFGFGPELVGFTKGKTRYSICAIPLGGFVKPAGESPEETTGKSDEYFAKPWHKRLAIVAAGPVMNYFLAWLLFAGLLFWKGEPVPSDATVIGDMAIGFPADKAGLQIGDAVLSVDGRPVGTWKDMADIIHKSSGVALKIGFKRGTEEKSAVVTPVKDSAADRGLIGISPEMSYRPVGAFRAAKAGLEQCWYWTSYTVSTLASKIYHMEKPDLAGPVGIMQMIGKAAHAGLEEFVSLVGLISVAVGFFNILPVPLLDGGHAAIYIYEGISRKKLTEKTLSVANTIGMAFLLTVLLFATYQDILRIRRPSWNPSSNKERTQEGSAPSAAPTSAPTGERPAP